jgi:hypothetical protein
VAPLLGFTADISAGNSMVHHPLDFGYSSFWVDARKPIPSGDLKGALCVVSGGKISERFYLKGEFPQ